MPECAPKRTTPQPADASDAAYYGRAGALLVGVQGVEVITGLTTAYVLTNFTSPATYATFGYVVAVLGVASLAALPGADAAIVRSAALGRDGTLGHATRLRFRTSLFGAGGMLVWAALLYSGGRRTEALAVAGGGLLLPVIYPCGSVLPFLQGQQRFQDYARALAAVEIAKTGAVAAAVLLFAWQGAPVVLAPFVVMGLGYWALNRRYRTGDIPDPAFDETARALTAAATLGAVAAHVDRLALGTFFTPETMAAYTLGLTLASPLRGVGSLTAKLVMPRIVGADATSARFRRRYATGLVLLAVALAVLVAAYWLAIPWVRPILFPSYAASEPIVRVLAAAMALNAFGVVAVQALWGVGPLRALYATQWLFPLQRLVLVAVGARWAGVSGILAAQVAHYALAAITVLVIWLRAPARQDVTSAD